MQDKDRKKQQDTLLPVKHQGRTLPAVRERPLHPQIRDAFALYMEEVNRLPLLDREEEQELARRFRDSGDALAARRLVEANLRFVVKLAHSYGNYNVKLVDLVQEGNIGLMKAVQKFNPDRGYRLISYAVWWIKAYMQNYIIRSWSMVRVGTAQAQKQLFFRRGGSEEQARVQASIATAEDAAGAEGEVVVLPAEKRSGHEVTKAYRDFSLDAEISDDGKERFVDMLPDQGANQEDQLAKKEILKKVSERLPGIIEALKEKERYILEKRILADEPETLQQIGELYGISRERVRQMETSLKRRLAKMLEGIDSADDLS